ncbi:hypothetical protein SKAU_G00072280 [Synaphobranchus kaupii]|uniref:Uncharacterized protein n=1 Tax=Synaphobranchus kaupii TaxID=118154 RepID=A0A9Q1G7V5_SYNKA|nr:hypothetical protein SKAU_G00072280 [Synaphobranchus kaupii]
MESITSRKDDYKGNPSTLMWMKMNELRPAIRGWSEVLGRGLISVAAPGAPRSRCPRPWAGRSDPDVTGRDWWGGCGLAPSSRALSEPGRRVSGEGLGGAGVAVTRSLDPFRLKARGGGDYSH